MLGRSGEGLSLQLGKFGAMSLASANFKIEGNVKFQVKNEGAEAVTLEVIPADADNDTFISTKFDPGWNPEIIREVKVNTTEGLALKWGY